MAAARSRRGSNNQRRRREQRSGRLSAAEMRKRLEDYIKKTVPLRLQPKTAKAYDSAWRRWLEFCAETGRAWREWDNVAVEQFIAWRRVKGQCYDPNTAVKGITIGSNLSGIRSVLMAEGLRPREFTTATMPRAAALLKAVKRVDADNDGEMGPGKRPLTAKHLEKMEAILAHLGHDGRVYAFYLAISHNTLRRSAEVLREDIGGISTDMILWENGTAFPRLHHPLDRTASLIFNKSKKNQHGDTQTAFMWCRCPIICALCRLRRLYRGNQLKRGAKLLRCSDGTVMDYARALAVIKELCEAIGLNKKDYGTHSLRSGGLHDAEDAGLSYELIDGQAYWQHPSSRKPYSRREAKKIDSKKLKAVLASKKPQQHGGV